MSDKTNWNRFIALLKRAWRVIWKKYQKEIKTFVNSLVDSAFVELGKHVDSAVQKKIKNEIIQKAIANEIDIYSNAGSLWVKNEIDSYMEKLGGE